MCKKTSAILDFKVFSQKYNKAFKFSKYKLKLKAFIEGVMLSMVAKLLIQDMNNIYIYICGTCYT